MSFFSLPLFVSCFVINDYCSSFLWLTYYSHLTVSPILSTCLILPFVVKLSVFFFHLWLPRAHAQFPVLGSVILSSLLLKLGVYGLNVVLLVLSGGGSVVLGLLCTFLSSLCLFFLPDFKSIVAYSLVSHMSFFGLCFTSTYVTSFSSGLTLSLSHAFLPSVLFILSQAILHCSSSRLSFFSSGVILILPVLLITSLFLGVVVLSCLTLVNGHFQSSVTHTLLTLSSLNVCCGSSVLMFMSCSSLVFYCVPDFWFVFLTCKLWFFCIVLMSDIKYHHALHREVNS